MTIRPHYLLVPTLLYLLVLVAPGTTFAGSTLRVYGTETDTEPSVVEEDTISVDDGVVVDSVEINNREIYDTSIPRYSNFLFRTANKLHIVTKQAVIRRELLLGVGAPFSAALAEETARNLRQKCRLVDAWVETERLPNDHLLVRVVTIDQWSLVGGVELSREGNRTRYKFGFEERNLLGYNQLLGVDWVIQEGDDNYVHGKFHDYRLFGKPVMLALEYNTDPRGKLSQVSLVRPYYNLDQHLYWNVTAAQNGGRRDVYGVDSTGATVRTGYWKNTGKQVDLIGEYRVGSRNTKLVGGVWYTYHTDEVTEFQGHGFVVPTDSTYHLPSLTLKGLHTQFLRLRRLNSLQLLEDYSLTSGVELQAGRAFDADGSGHLYDALDLIARVGDLFGHNIVTATHQQSWWLKSGRELRRRSVSSLRYYNNSLPFLTLAARLQYQTDYYDAVDSPVRLGGTSGIRGYDEFALAGDRAAIFNLETRWFPGVELLSALIGGAIFADAGRTFDRGESFTLNDLQYSFGFGLRISLERATKSEIVRMDCAVRKDGTIQLAFGTGQYF